MATDIEYTIIEVTGPPEIIGPLKAAKLKVTSTQKNNKPGLHIQTLQMLKDELPPGEFNDLGIKVRDKKERIIDISFSIYNKNSATPKIQSVLSAEVFENEELNFPVRATDPKGKTLVYTFNGKPSRGWLNIDPALGIISGTAPEYSLKTSSLRAYVKVSNGKQSVVRMFLVSVKPKIKDLKILKVPDASVDKISLNKDFSIPILIENPYPKEIINFSITANATAPWLYIEKADETKGLLRGKPTNVGYIESTVTVSLPTKNIQTSAQFSFEVIETKPIISNLPTSPDVQGKVGELFKHQINVVNPIANDTLTYALFNGPNEAWLQYEPNTEGLLISGIPKAEGQMIPTLVVSNSRDSRTVNFDFEILKNDSLVKDPAKAPQILAVPSGIEIEVGKDYDGLVETNDNPDPNSPYEFEISDPQLGDWISIDKYSGFLSGRPTKEETIHRKIVVKNFHGQAEATLEIKVVLAVKDLTPIFSGPSFINAKVYELFKEKIRVENPDELKDEKISLSLGPGYPLWIELYPEQLLLSGEASSEGDYTMTLYARNSAGESKLDISIKISPKEERKKGPSFKSSENKKKAKDTLGQREVILTKAFATGNPLLLLKMPELEGPHFIRDLGTWSKGQLKATKQALGGWIYKKVDKIVLTPGAEWAHLKIINPTKRTFRSVKSGIQNSVMSIAKDRNSSFRGIFVLRRRFRRRRKRKGGSLAQFFASELLSNAFKGLLKTIKNVRKAIYSASKAIPGVSDALTKLGNTTTGQWIQLTYTKFANTNLGQRILTSLDDVETIKKMTNGLKRFGGGIVRLYQKGGKIITTGLTFVGNVAKSSALISKITAGNLLSNRGLVTGNSLGLATLVITGNPVLAAVAGVAGAVAGGISNFLAAKPQAFSAGSSFFDKLNNSARYLQRKYGYGQFNINDVKTQGDLNQMAARAKLRGTVFSKTSMAVRAGNTGLIMGSMAAILATFLGINPLIAGAVGFGAGAAGQVLWDRYAGPRTAKMFGKLSSTGIFGKLAAVPYTVLLGNIQSNAWLLGEMKSLFVDYRGNVEEYLDDNWSKTDSLQLIFNLVGAGSYLVSNYSLVSFLSGTVFKGLLGKLAPNLFKGFGLAVAIGTLVGTVGGFLLGTAVLPMLGVSFLTAASVTSAAAITAAAVGGVVGGIVGGLVSLAIPGVGWLASIPITTFFAGIGTVIGQTIGAFFDKTVSNFMNNALNTINSLQALMAISNIMMSPINANNAVLLMMSLISLFSVMDKVGDQHGSSNCLTPECSGTETTATNNVNEINLGYYNITLINSELYTWDYSNTKNVMEVLQNLDSKTQDEITKRKIFLTLGEDTLYIDEKFALISINPELNNYEQFSLILKENIQKIASENQDLDSISMVKGTLSESL